MAKNLIGVIGIGNMGSGIAKNLLQSGKTLAVWDANTDALKQFAKNNKARVMEPGDMAEQCGTILFVVPTSKEIEAIITGRGGMLSRAAKNSGLVFYDLTTSDPVHSTKLAAQARKKGVLYMDAGMSGGAMGAQAGTLTLMIGGDEDAFKRTRRYLKLFTKNLFYLGKSGAGHTMKLVHNMVCHTNFVAVCEGARMAEKAGIEPADMIDVFNVSNARSYISEVRFPKNILSDKWNGGSRVANLAKDLAMAVDMAKNLEADIPLGRDTNAFLKKAVRHGMADDDFTHLFRDYDAIQKPTKPKRKK